ncbi:hypothetical protein FRC04_003474 [Tulasnella sp. 424]|nr:hypothetical protein FRC04_003474 [Tulasnella sp. 424]
MPTEYDLDAYDQAILYPPGMLDLQNRAAINLCGPCKSYLTGDRPRVPEFALANFYYFARERLPDDVKEAFAKASPCDLQLVSRCRASNITFRFTESIGSNQFGQPTSTSQFFCRGNTIILPQDPDGVRNVLPPSPDDINKAVCALFVSRERPSLQNIARLGPVLVSKPTVKTLLDFLLTKNPFYRDTGTRFSQPNYDALFAPEDVHRQIAIPQSVELGFLQLDEAVRSSTSDYTDRYQSLDNLPDESDELLMEPIGYTDGDHTPQNYTDMKVKALSWCRRGHAFIKSQAGSTPFSDRDEAFLSSTFPHLDPWGLVALNHPHRQYKTSLLRQVQHLLRLHNSPFERDPAFAFILWNIIQRSEVNKCMNFRVKASQRDSIIKDILSFPPETLDQLSEKWRLDPSARPTTPDEKKIFRVLRKLRHVGSNLKGSAAQKICLRNEIRALINTLGTPALFVTLNPADVHHPLVRILAGSDDSAVSHLERGLPLPEYDKQQRAVLVAQHPAAAAQFFDIIISAFVNTILCPKDGPGLFGKCNGYYGTVEAQGKGTLHLHMLIWLDGHPNPQAMRDKFEDDPTFKDAVFKWLDDTIATSTPGSDDVVSLDTESRPTFPKDEPDPRSVLAPQAADFDDIDAFQTAFDEFLSKLVLRTNWHVHSDTCWKKLKRGQARDDAHCRLGMDGSTRKSASLDPDSGSILYRRLHPRINNYNPTTLHAIQSNMDIKHIGSGEAAKACLYYVTDYITKFSLPVHSGLAALSYAIKRNNEKFDNAQSASAEVMERSLLTKSVNAMMARLEISHQQVMSYLVGGGDHYTSHSFRNLYWGEVDRHIRRLEKQRDTTDPPVPMQDDDDDDSPTRGSEQFEPEVVITLKDKSVTATNQLLDYTLRPSDDDFSALSIWDYVSQTEKVPIPNDSKCTNNAGRRSKQRNAFMSSHPQHESHVVRRRSPLVPVLLGPTIPRDTTPEEMESWCRAMLILFKPWRCLDDLKTIGQSWKDAFEQSEFTEDALRIMHNINVLHECKDARTTYDEQRRAGKVTVDLIPGVYMSEEPDMPGVDLEDALLQDDSLDAQSDVDDDDAPDEDPSGAVGPRTSTSLDPEVQRAIALMELRSKEYVMSQQPPDECFPFSLASADDYANIASYTDYMKSLKRTGKPQLSYCTPPSRRDFSDAAATAANVAIDSVAEFHTMHERIDVVSQSTNATSPIEEIAAIESEFGFCNNPEQSRAFRIVAEHMLSEKNISEQLLMYLGGVGGTGKSHVINAIVELFRRCGVAESLRLSAPTGIAAVLIRGHTIHSLTLLPKSVHRNDPAKLEDLWRDVRWLIIDEISMISAKLLSEISHQICIAKGSNPMVSGKPFGGVNVLFSGDFGQLRPVKAKSLFSHDLVRKITINTAQTPNGQSGLYGAFLWRSINRHVELRKNWRHMHDPKYANLVGRVRIGRAWQGRRKHLDEQKGCGSNYKRPDWDVLLTRTLDQLSHQKGGVEGFADAPFIVARKSVRDSLNNMRITEFANATGQGIEYMVARDKIGKRFVTQTERARLIRLNSSTTNDSLGVLPLVPGMKVMITENVALAQSVVNGAEGTLVSVKYKTDSSGNKVAVCAFVKIPGSGVKIDGLQEDVVPIVPTSTQFTYVSPQGAKFHISRSQLPLLPAYAYTDYKAQGRTLEKAIVDLADCNSLQSVYVMLSRVRTLHGLAILRWFKSTKLYQNLQEEFRHEFSRLRKLHDDTEQWFHTRKPFTVVDVDRQTLLKWQTVSEMRNGQSVSSTPLQSGPFHSPISTSHFHPAGDLGA